MKIALKVATGVLMTASLVGCAAPRPRMRIRSAAAGRALEGTVTMTHAWRGVVEALVQAHGQTGLRYAVVPPKFEGMIGPFTIGETIGVGDLVERAARASGTEVHWIGDVAVFEPRTRPIAESGKPRDRVCRLSRYGHSSAIRELSELSAHEDPSIRFHALAALCKMEGDFMRCEWPGRVSIFEVKRETLDRDALFWTLEEGGGAGSPSWKRAVRVLARAREPYLARHTWSPAWYKVPDTIRLSLWALGRSGDITASRTLRKRIKKSFTNDPEDMYLAAVGLGRLGDERTLIGQLKAGSKADTRRAAALGLGLCKGQPAVVEALVLALGDKDSGVRYLACLSLGRIGTRSAVARLRELALGKKNSDALRCAALDGLGVARSADAVDILFKASHCAPAIAAGAADLLGKTGGMRAQARLKALMGHSDRWVRASAACALGKLGTREAVQAAGAYLQDEATDDDGRIAALIGLGLGRSPLAADVLGSIALDSRRHTRLRRYAVLALARLANRRGHDTLRKLADFGTPEYMPLALRYLNLATPEATAAHLIGFLAKGNRDTSAAAACRLAELGCGAGVRELLEGSNVFDNHARMMHMWGAIRARGPEVVPALVEACSSKRSAIRQSAALGLGGRADVAAVDTLIGLASDKSARVRRAAAQSLGLCGDPAAIPVLIRLAETDRDAKVYAAAIRSLRYRAFSVDARVKKTFQGLAGTPRDIGVTDTGRPSVADQPAHSFVLRRWAWSLEDNDMCNITYESSVTYDSHNKRVVLFGAHGRHADSPNTGLTWFYDTGKNKWRRLVGSAEWPNSVCCVEGTTVYDPANRVVVQPTSGGAGHGWGNALRINMRYTIPWVMDTRTDQWRAAGALGHPGGLQETAGSFDARHGVVVYWWGPTKAYDAYANEWTTLSRTMPRKKGPAGMSVAGGRFDPVTGRLLVAAADSTWAFDPAKGVWTDLKPKGGKGWGQLRMVYDSANDVMLAFEASKGADAMSVWVYHLRDNRWERLPPAYPSPRYTRMDVTYDRARNVVVISGGTQDGSSGEPTVRETWTYRYKLVSASMSQGSIPGRPRELSVIVRKGDGPEAHLRWKAPNTGTAERYRVYRGTGTHAWKVEWKKIADVGPSQREYTDREPKTTTLTFYRVSAVDGSGREAPASYPCRTAPPAPRWSTAVVTANGIQLTWEQSPARDVVGYHVYRAPISGRSYWRQRFDPNRLAKPLKRVTKTPEAQTCLVDRDAVVRGRACEFAWPDSYVYFVRAVNVWGIEGGPSPATPALSDAPGPVRVLPWLDGRRIVLWKPGRVEDVRGYFLMRQDDWNKHYVFRWHPSPRACTGFLDDIPFPVSDRRRYYVSGVDAMGAVGIPSPGVWSHGIP